MAVNVTGKAHERVETRAWVVLALGVLAQAAGSLFLSTPAFLIPLLHTERGLTLAQAGLIAAAPTFGMVFTLVAWGALADRIGERWVIAWGIALVAIAAGGAAVAAATSGSQATGGGGVGYLSIGLLLLLGGMAAGSTSAASGRIIIGWFPKNRRGLAMGIRQMSQPLGVAIAAIVVPPVAANDGIAAALLVSVGFCAVIAIACAIGLRNPAREVRAEGTVATVNPYRVSGALWRIHGVSILLVIPQFTLSTFGLVWLITDQHLSPAPAGLVIGISQFVGALGRIAVGVLSDRVGSRLRPLRWVAIAAIVAMLALAALDHAFDHILSGTLTFIPVVLLVIATTISVADNGLAFTAVAEIAGVRWSGRALGAQNTGQWLAASAVAPLAGALIGIAGYPVAFAAAAVCALISVPLVPREKTYAHPGS